MNTGGRYNGTTNPNPLNFQPPYNANLLTPGPNQTQGNLPLSLDPISGEMKLRVNTPFVGAGKQSYLTVVR